MHLDPAQSTAPSVHADVVSEPIDAPRLIALVDNPRSGAVVTFRGVVRNHDEGRGVTGIDYSSHPDAASILANIATEVAVAHGVEAIAVEHRVGHLDVGEDAMVAVVGAAHRREAFDACSALVDTIKDRLPVWKNQQFADGSAEWTGLPSSE